MKIVIFAGGAGRRLWPISRVKSPKQFEPIVGSSSTLRLAVDRVLPKYGAKNIYISTNEDYVELVRNQLPELPLENIIGEPVRRDLAPAVGLSLIHLTSRIHQEDSLDEPMAILWGDNTMDQVPNFLRVMGAAETLLRDKKARILFIGETPRFANQNLGWLGLGPQLGTLDDQPFYQFDSLTYRPELADCHQMFAQKSHVWNTGYFVTTPRYVQNLYSRYQPEMAALLGEIAGTIGTADYRHSLHRVYPRMEAISFDDAILRHVRPGDAVVLHSEMGWSDPGTLYALKEALDPDLNSNVTRGKVVDDHSKDCLVYNYESDKLVVAIGLEGLIVVNTEDALLVVHKDQIPLVKTIITGFEGTDLESFS